jgi:hypothetical protein
MRAAISGFTGAALLICTGARAEELRVKDATVLIEPMTFYSGQRNRFPHWGPRMDCPTESDRPAGVREKWLQTLCGDKANQKPIIKQMGGTTRGGTCGYARYSVACVKIP